MWQVSALANMGASGCTDVPCGAAFSELPAQRASWAMDRYARAGLDEDFAELHGLLAPRLRSVCSALVGRDDAEDLMQEVLLKLHRFRERFAPGGNVVVWAKAIARTTAIDRSRRSLRRAAEVMEPISVERYMGDDGNCPEAVFIAVELDHTLGAQLAQLPEHTRAAYQMVKLRGLSVAEAAQRLGLSGAAVRQRVHRAHAFVRAQLARDAAL